MVACAENTGQDDSVDEATSSFRTRHLEDDGERRCRRGSGVESWTVVRYVEANEDDGDNVEEQNAPEDVLHDSWEVLCRVLRLTGRDGN